MDHVTVMWNSYAFTNSNGTTSTVHIRLPTSDYAFVPGHAHHTPSIHSPRPHPSVAMVLAAGEQHGKRNGRTVRTALDDLVVLHDIVHEVLAQAEVNQRSPRILCCAIQCSPVVSTHDEGEKEVKRTGVDGVMRSMVSGPGGVDILDGLRGCFGLVAMLCEESLGAGFGQAAGGEHCNARPLC
ncbi:hypothetical protein BDW22DRAFT_845343 [Trametopsis cervina]|nr:hypothetical protein BDW22DRAFT_845343 [Trametopsis cervina]